MRRYTVVRQSIKLALPKALQKASQNASQKALPKALPKALSGARLGMQEYWNRNRVFILLAISLVLINSWYFLVGYSEVFAVYFHQDILLSRSHIVFYVSSAIVAIFVALFDHYTETHGAKLTTIALVGLLIGTLLLIYATNPEVGSPGSLLSMSYLLIGASYTWIVIVIYRLLSSCASLYKILLTSVLSFFFTPLLYTAMFQYLPETQLLVWAPAFALISVCLVMLVWKDAPREPVFSSPDDTLDRQFTEQPLAFIMRYRNQLAQIATIAIVLVAIRSIRIGGLWGTQATPTPDNLLLVIGISQMVYLLLAVPVFILYIRQSSTKSSLFPFLVLITLLLAVSYMESIQDVSWATFGLTGIVERLTQSLFPLILIVCSRRLPGSFFRVCGLAISAENIVAILLITFFNGIQMNKTFVLLFMVFVIVMLIVFMKTENERDGGTGKTSGRVDDILAKRSAELGKKGSLTAREEEVMLFLAQGRSIPHISRRLQVAEGTIRTHVKHIYQKLGIHSKQELLDMFADDEDIS
jgi:DNA-binding CsgD family transcriptional regulator